MHAKELSERLWVELEFRQTHYWTSFHRFALSIIIINISPYLRPEIAEPLGRIIYVFPTVAFAIALICAWYLGAEYHRLDMVRKAYNRVIHYDRVVPRMPRRNMWERAISVRMGNATSIIFGLGFALMSLLNMGVLFTFPIYILNHH